GYTCSRAPARERRLVGGEWRARRWCDLLRSSPPPQPEIAERAEAQGQQEHERLRHRRHFADDGNGVRDDAGTAISVGGLYSDRGGAQCGWCTREHAA